MSAAALSRVLAELPLPLGPDATSMDVVGLVLAVEDGYGVVLPDALITVDHVRSRERIEAAVDSLAT